MDTMGFDLVDGVHLDEQSKQTLKQELDEACEHLLNVGDLMRFVVSQLRRYEVVVAQGSTDEFAEAAAIVLHPLSLNWVASPEILPCRLTPSERKQVLDLLYQRITERRPFSYLVNLAYFCNLPFYVDERVLIPRSPMAELINQGFYPYFEQTGDSQSFFDHHLEDKQLPTPERILDLCTGSGCIAIALAKRFADATVDAVDINTDALDVAATNVDHHELDGQVNLFESDLFAKLPKENQYELIVTNPPYVDAALMADLPPEFLHEPELALAAGQDGLDLVHKILYEASDYLTADGLLVCEVGESRWALSQAYPDISFDWLRFEKTEAGVFAIDYEQLVAYRNQFAKFVG